MGHLCKEPIATVAAAAPCCFPTKQALKGKKGPKASCGTRPFDIGRLGNTNLIKTVQSPSLCISPNIICMFRYLMCVLAEI